MYSVPKKPLRNRTAIALVGLSLLSGCVSFGGEAPATMLILSADNRVQAGTSVSAGAADAVVIASPNAPRKLNTNRVLVEVSQGNVAYLKGGVWADKPATLIHQLLAETVAAKTGQLVLSEAVDSGKNPQTIAGQLLEMGIDEASMEAVVTFDAVRTREGNPIERRRFESRVAVNKVDIENAGIALNEAANNLAEEVADWVAKR